MLREPAYTLRVILACMKKDVKSALTERVFTIIGVFVPVNVLILLSLFVLAGSHAPTAVVMNDTGPYAQQFYDAMDHAHSFQLQKANASEADDLISAGRIVAVVTIPPDFDTRVAHNQPVQVGVRINNLNTDFTNDIRRAVPLSITTFTLGVLVLCLGYVLGWTQPEGIYWLTTLLVIALVALLSSGLGVAIGALTQRIQAVIAISINVALYLFFLAGGTGVLAFEPNWLQNIAAFVPLTYGNHALQMAVFYSSADQLGRDSAILSFSALAALALGILAMRKGIARG